MGPVTIVEQLSENSDADRALAQDWIRCSRCHIWCHKQCGEESNVYDMSSFVPNVPRNLLR